MRLRPLLLLLALPVEKFLELLGNNNFATIFGVLAPMLIGYMVARWTFQRHKSNLKRGEFQGQLVVQSHELIDDGNGHQVLCFTTEKVYPNIAEIFPNPALEKLFLQRALATSEENPLIDLSGNADHAKRTITSHLSSVVEGLDGSYVVLVTREAQDAVERKLTRVFLITRELLTQFHSWDRAKSFRTEHSSHWPRILNLHLAARRVLDGEDQLIPDQGAFYGEIAFGPRRALGSVAVDWKEHGFDTGPNESPFRRG